MNLQPHDWAQLANTLKSVREDDVDALEETAEIKACGANKPGGGGFAAGNTCARGGGGGGNASNLPVYKGSKTSYSDKSSWDSDTGKLSYSKVTNGDKIQANNGTKIVGEWNTTSNSGWIRQASVDGLREKERYGDSFARAGQMFIRDSRKK